MTFAIAERGPETVVSISGELDISNVDRLERAVKATLHSPVSRLVVDVSDVSFADSSAIAMWVRWSTAVGELRLRGVSPLLQRVIDSMGLATKLLGES